VLQRFVTCTIRNVYGDPEIDGSVGASGGPGEQLMHEPDLSANFDAGDPTHLPVFIVSIAL